MQSQTIKQRENTDGYFVVEKAKSLTQHREIGWKENHWYSSLADTCVNLYQ